MQNRLSVFIKDEGLTSGRLAEIIGVQPSSISHILSGRNKPGFDFISKLLQRFPNLNPKWLILGEEPMYVRDDAPAFTAENTSGDEKNSYTKFDNDLFLDLNTPEFEGNDDRQNIFSVPENPVELSPNTDALEYRNHGRLDEIKQRENSGGIGIERIVIFFKDGSYKEYNNGR